MRNTLIIISGASRGLGLALAQQLAAPNTSLISIARSNNSDLAAYCQQQGAQYQHIGADLAQPNGAAHAAHELSQLLTAHDAAALSHCWLINNAGTVAPMAQTHQLNEPYSIGHALQLNIGSVMSLTASFLAHSPHTADRRLLNISSGAGRGAVPGWAVYGATKAAIDYYTQTVALEHPDVRAVALAPGVIDTDMQADIRATHDSHFPNRQRFVALHQNKQLLSATATASHIARYLASNDFGNQLLDDIRHYF